MKKNLPVIGLLSLTLVAAMAFFTSDFAASAAIVTCDAGSNMSYDQAKDAFASGELVLSRNPDLATNRVTVAITNNTPCAVPLSLSTYKMFGPYSLATQSQQQFFEGTAAATIGANSTVTLETGLPTCAAQYDIWYGNAPQIIPDNQAYGVIITGDHVRQDQFCQVTTGSVGGFAPSQINANLSAESVCVVPESVVSFTSDVNGDGINSKTIEKDTVGNGVFTEVASWGAGGSTNTYSEALPAGFTGTYTLRLVVNGSEKARQNVTVNAICGPAVTTSSSGSSSVVPPTIEDGMGGGDGIYTETIEQAFIPSFPDTGFAPRGR